MYAVTQDYIDAIMSPVQAGELVGTINGSINFTSEDVLLGSASISNQCADSTDVKVGSVYVGTLQITFCNKNILPRGSWEGSVIRIYWHQHIFNEYGYSVEEVPCGVYVVSEANHSAEGVVVTAFDYMSKLDKRVNFSALTPGTIYSYLRVIANRCLITLGQDEEDVEDLPNGTETLTLYQDSDIETYRDLLSWLAQMVGGFATFNRAGELVLRQWGVAPVVTFSARERFAGCYFSDFETFYSGVSFVDLNTQTVRVYSHSGGGLVMSLGANPFLQNQLEPYQRYLCNNILNAIDDLRAVPFRASALGNPAFDLGDVIEFTGMTAGASSNGVIMSYVYTFGHQMDLEGYGENPATQGAQSKTDKNIAGLTRQSAANEEVFLFLTNVEAFESETISNFEDGEFELGSLIIGATKDTDIEAQVRATYHVDFTVQDNPPEFGAFRVWLRYELDGEVVKRVPFWRPLGLISTTYDEYEDTVVDYQPLLNISGGDLKTLTVFFEYEYTGPTSEGVITIPAEGFELTVKGQGIAASDRWDGLITAEDEVPLYQVDELHILPIADNIVITYTIPQLFNLSDVVPLLDTAGLVNPVNNAEARIRCSPPSSNFITEDGDYNIMDETGGYNIVSE